MKQLNYYKRGVNIAAAILLSVGWVQSQTVIKVGDSQTYKTIQSAYNAGIPTDITGKGAYQIVLQSDYSPVKEAYPITLGAKTGASSANSITIKPATGVKKTIENPNQTKAIGGFTFISGFNYVSTTSSLSGITSGMTVFGKGVYSTSSAFFTVQSVSTSSIYLSSPSTASFSDVTLFFGTSNTRTIVFDGADYVTIDGVSRTDVSTGLIIQNPNAINANTLRFVNGASNNTIKNCIIKGANVSPEPTTNYAAGQITFADGDNDFNTITDNDLCDIEGAASMPVCMIATTASTANTSNDITISNNKMYNIESGFTPSSACGYIYAYNINTGCKNYSVLNNKIYWTKPASLYANLYGININLAGAGSRIENNIVGYANADATGTATLSSTNLSQYVYGIYAKNSTIKNNIVGGMDAAAFSFYGIRTLQYTVSVNPNDFCSQNKVSDIRVTSGYTTGNSNLYGLYIYTTSSMTNMNVNNNIIRNLTLSNTANMPCYVYGIGGTGASTSGSFRFNYSGNKINNLTSGTASSTKANYVYGLTTYFLTDTIEGNLIYNLKPVNDNSVACTVNGLLCNGSNSTGITVKNNIIRLGVDVAGSATMHGIYLNSAVTSGQNISFYHNSVYIGGKQTGGTSGANSYAFNSAANLSSNIKLVNNILVNYREKVFAETHYAMSVYDYYLLSSNYNLLKSYSGMIFVSGTASVYSLAEWQLNHNQDLNSKDANPMFVNPTKETPAMYLRPGSPANGSGQDLSTIVSDDFYGNIRSAKTPHDIGAVAYPVVMDSAYQYNATAHVYVSNSGDDANDGTSWAKAKKDLQRAINSAVWGDSIFVAAGTYYPTMSIPGMESDNRAVAFQMKEGVKLFGGFAGTETALSQRKKSDLNSDGVVSPFEFTNATVLSGDIDGEADGWVWNTTTKQWDVTLNRGNCYHVVYNTQTFGDSTAINGCTILGGNADHRTSAEYANGGGVYDSGNLLYDQCIFTQNSSTNSGGAIYCTGDAQVANSKVVGNRVLASASAYGGGVYLLTQSGISGSVVSDNAITTTSGTVYGGGVYTASSDSIINCTISNNTGDGIYGSSSAGNIRNCIIKSNTRAGINQSSDTGVISGSTVSSNGSYGILKYGGSGDIYNCIVDGNGSRGVYVASSGSSTTMSNLTVTNNKNGGIFNAGNGSIDNCTVSGNTSSNSGGGINNSGSGAITNCVVRDNSSSSSSSSSNGGGIYNSGSGAITNCVVHNNTSYSSSYSSSSYGGGICNSGSGAITNCEVRDNKSSYYSNYSPYSSSYGGGIYNSGSGAITNCIVRNNTSSSSISYYNYGGGVYNSGGATISNCIITGNSCLNSSNSFYTQGGGIYQVSGVISNTIVGNNTAFNYAGIYNNNSTNSVYNCTITNNAGVGMTNGVAKNSIFWNNTVSGITSTYCAFTTSTTGTGNILLSTANTGSTSGVKYASFVRPTTFVGAPTTDAQKAELENADWKLSAGSACIDAGTNSTLSADAVGVPRPLGNGVDMGAYENLQTNPLPYTQAFETTPLNISLGGKWFNAPLSGQAGKGGLFTVNSTYSNYNDAMQTPYFQAGSTDKIKLAFDLLFKNVSTSTLEKLSVMLVYPIANRKNDTLAVFNNQGGNITYRTYSYDIASKVGANPFAVRIAAHGVDAYNIYYWGIDNIKVGDFTTTDAPEVVVAKSSEPLCFVRNGQLLVSQVAEGDLIEVYSAEGRVVAQRKATGDYAAFNLPQRGVYVVKVNRATGVYSTKVVR